jgi:hypothetical protein
MSQSVLPPIRDILPGIFLSLLLGTICSGLSSQDTSMNIHPYRPPPRLHRPRPPIPPCTLLLLVRLCRIQPIADHRRRLVGVYSLQNIGAAVLDQYLLTSRRRVSNLTTR